MKVLALNSSPHLERGCTAAILTPLLQGMAEASANVELVYVHPLDVKPCLGCLACWTRTPGRCVQRDDMADLLPKIGVANILVLATPVYVDGMTSTLKVVLDRCLPLLQPFFEIRDDHCRHPIRIQPEDSKLMLVSVSGFTELGNFSPLVSHAKAFSRNMDRRFVGAILRPVAWAIDEVSQRGVPVDDVLQAAREAGRQVVRDGAIAQETLDTVSRELAPRQALMDRANADWERQLKRHAQDG
jgi:NAD(P)H-dependent FMN reductase